MRLPRLAPLRRMAVSQMVDTVTIRRPGDVDPLTGVPTTATVYVGRAKVQSYEAQESHPQAGGHVFTEVRSSLHVPVGSYVPQVGDIATVDAAPNDPTRVGQQVRIVSLLRKTAATAYRLGVEEVVA